MIIKREKKVLYDLLKYGVFKDRPAKYSCFHQKVGWCLISNIIAVTVQ